MSNDWPSLHPGGVVVRSLGFQPQVTAPIHPRPGGAQVHTTNDPGVETPGYEPVSLRDGSGSRRRDDQLLELVRNPRALLVFESFLESLVEPAAVGGAFGIVEQVAQVPL